MIKPLHDAHTRLVAPAGRRRAPGSRRGGGQLDFGPLTILM